VDFILNSPQSKVWGPENAALLKSLRLSAGLDIATLARRNIVSTTQARQLEEGGDSSFYTPEIKFSLGKKLLKFLGHDLKLEVVTVVAPSTSDTAAKHLVIETLGAQAKDNLPQPLANKTPAFVLPLFLSMTLVVIGAIWFGSGNELAAPPAVVVQSSPSIKAEAPAQETVATVFAQPAPQAQCSWNNSEEEVQPDSPQKAGDYVHVVALQATTVCVMDGQKKVASLNLQMGDAKSIYGPSPFKVYSADLKAVKVYFQGQQIKLANPEAIQVKLNSAAYMPRNN
jgi:transcriptional regulator with XRE-family HTH domain